MHHLIELPDEMSPLIVACLIVATGGLFIIAWIYLKNKEIIHINPKVELDPIRGLSVLLILPLILAIIVYISSLILPNIISKIIFYTLGTFVMFAIFKYLFEFCFVVTQTTKTSLITWFLPFCITFSGVILLSVENLAGLVLIITPLIHIPILQNQINVFYRNQHYRKEKHKIYR